MKSMLFHIAVLALAALLASSLLAEAQTPSASDDPLRHGHALLIGISKYDDHRWPALVDVPLQVDELKRGLQAHFDSIDVATDLNSDALRTRLAEFLEKYNDERESRLFIYYAGHGYTELIPERNEYRGYITATDTPAIDGTGRATTRLAARRFRWVRYALSSSSPEPSRSWFSSTAASRERFSRIARATKSSLCRETEWRSLSRSQPGKS